MVRLFVKAIVFLLCLTPPLLAGQTPRQAGFKALQAAIAPVKTVDLLRVLVSGSPEGDIPPAMLAHFLYLRRHFGLAAVYFMFDSDLQPKNAASRANLAGVLTELNAADPVRFPQVILDWALENARLAHKIAPENAGISNTLAFVTTAVAERSDTPARYWKEALDAAKFATRAGPDRPEYWATLARIYAATGNEKGKIAALEQARISGPRSDAYYMTANALGQHPPVPTVEASPTPAIRNVDFRCAEICPKSIIGQVNLVSCRLENDTQQKNCEAGRKYATSYNCQEEFPVFGALPGLSSVGSVCVPGLCVHIRLASKARVDFRIEGGPAISAVSPYMKVDGNWSNKNGFSIDHFEHGVKFSLLNRGAGSAGKITSDITGIAPAELKLGTTDNKPVVITPSVMSKAVIGF